MILQIIIIFVAICLIAIIINGIDDCSRIKRIAIRSKRIAIPFKESMDLIHIPIVTFTNNNVKLHFLLDTGSDDSYISPSVLPSLILKNKIASSNKILGAGNEIASDEIVIVDLLYKTEIFETPLRVANLPNVFSEKGVRGITIHGVLGSIFFERHKYQIDFDTYEAYPKK